MALKRIWTPDQDSSLKREIDSPHFQIIWREQTHQHVVLKDIFSLPIQEETVSMHKSFADSCG